MGAGLALRSKQQELKVGEQVVINAHPQSLALSIDKES
jgi:hypothetical protein